MNILGPEKLREPSPRLYRLSQAEYESLHVHGVLAAGEPVRLTDNGFLAIDPTADPPFGVQVSIPPADILDEKDHSSIPRLRRLTVKEYQIIMEHGLLLRRNDLVEGWLVEKLVFSPQHYYVIGCVSDLIRQSVPAGCVVRTRAGVTLDDSMTDPDVSIVQGSHWDYDDHHPYPSEIELLVEIGLPCGYSKLAIRSYARNRIRRCWFLDLNERSLLAHELPSGTGDQPEFRERTLFKSHQSIPFIVGGKTIAEIPVAKLFGLRSSQ